MCMLITWQAELVQRQKEMKQETVALQEKKAQLRYQLNELERERKDKEAR